MQAALPPFPSANPAAGADANKGIDPKTVAWVRSLLNYALQQELKVAWQSLESCKTVDEIRRNMEGASVILEVGIKDSGPRVWLLPFLFGDVVLSLPHGCQVRVRTADVKRAWEYLKANGLV